MTACRHLATHFHCSPYEFFDKPSGEIWNIYDGVLQDVAKQRRDSD